MFLCNIVFYHSFVNNVYEFFTFDSWPKDYKKWSETLIIEIVMLLRNNKLFFINNELIINRDQIEKKIFWLCITIIGVQLYSKQPLIEYYNINENIFQLIELIWIVISNYTFQLYNFDWICFPHLLLFFCKITLK
jgi:hypothetical protein